MMAVLNSIGVKVTDMATLPLAGTRPIWKEQQDNILQSREYYVLAIMNICSSSQLQEYIYILHNYEILKHHSFVQTGGYSQI